MSYEISNTQPEDAQLTNATANADLELSDEDLEAVAGGSHCYGHDHDKKYKRDYHKRVDFHRTTTIDYSRERGYSSDYSS